jgi:hypothetical protein
VNPEAGAATVTDALADLVESATLVAFTVDTPAGPAVNNPACVTDPAVVDHVTAVFVFPVTVAVNCCCFPGATFAEGGKIATLTTGVTSGGVVTEAVFEASLSAQPGTFTAAGQGL